MLYFWTKESEVGISEIKYDRKALYGALKRYSIHTSKLTSVLTRGAWRTIEEPMLPVHKARLECMIAVSGISVYQTVNIDIVESNLY